MSDHSFITNLAMQSLDEQDQSVWRDQADLLIAKYCFWPDDYFDPEQYAKIAPYQLVIDGLQFHYPPSSQPGFHWQMIETDDGAKLERMPEQENRNWTFMRDGIKHYLTRITDDLSSGRCDEAAKRLGILLHVMQDTHELHALEGPWGTDMFVLDRLLECPDGDEYVSPSILIATRASDCREGDISGYRPKLLGTSIDEAVFRLYGQYVNANLSNRLLQVPLAQALIRSDQASANRLMKQISERISKLSADVIHTVTALAMDRFDSSEVEELGHLKLDPMAAVQRPWFARGMYKFTPFVPGACLDEQRHRHPLCLRQPDGSTRKFVDGWGSGVHVQMNLVFEIPSGVFRRLTTQIGLHDPLGKAGCVDLAVTFGGKTVVEQRLDEKSPTKIIDVPIYNGGELRFVLREVPGSNPDDNNIVWADPTLSKDELTV